MTRLQCTAAVLLILLCATALLTHAATGNTDIALDHIIVTPVMVVRCFAAAELPHCCCYYLLFAAAAAAACVE